MRLTLRAQVVQLDALADVFKLTPVEVSQAQRCTLEAVGAWRVTQCTYVLHHAGCCSCCSSGANGKDHGRFRRQRQSPSHVHVTRHTSHATRHTPRVTRHTSHVTRHTSHVTPHTSHTIGKFICITPDEMQSVQKFITQRGRVSIADLAVESNRYVSKQPHALKRTH